MSEDAPKNMKRKKRDAHHILLFAALVSAAIITIVISIVTLRIETVCTDGQILPNNTPKSFCQFTKQTSYSWPFKQVDGDPIWPLIANYLLFSALIFGAARAELAIKGHLNEKQ